MINEGFVTRDAIAWTLKSVFIKKITEYAFKNIFLQQSPFDLKLNVRGCQNKCDQIHAHCGYPKN
ncbi:hypothetical protein CDG68_08555 [Acinetobacter wuhouensis]|uniref:Uncharacterized protein n=1 Tax=Acinetobacter wuhouensis TaxID=1879050 RepID=A0A3G2T0X1_9GAMM|nr:hypothetical protein CDG68_08555 [Acinetobacter wuhouensis]